MRVRKIRNVLYKLENSPSYYNQEEIPKLIEKIGNGIIHVEIGSGKGRFIVDLAKINKDITYVAIEKETSIAYKICKKIVAAGISNVFVLTIDANDVDELFPKNFFDKIYLNFSDPWPKTRHRKRRLTYNSFLEKYKIILKPDCIVEFKTDNSVLFWSTFEQLEIANAYVLYAASDIANDKHFNIETEYEEKFKVVETIKKIIFKFNK